MSRGAASSPARNWPAVVAAARLVGTREIVITARDPASRSRLAAIARPPAARLAGNSAMAPRSRSSRGLKTASAPSCGMSNRWAVRSIGSRPKASSETNATARSRSPPTRYRGWTSAYSGEAANTRAGGGNVPREVRKSRAFCLLVTGCVIGAAPAEAASDAGLAVRRVLSGRGPRRRGAGPAAGDDARALPALSARRDVRHRRRRAAAPERRPPTGGSDDDGSMTSQSGVRGRAGAVRAGVRVRHVPGGRAGRDRHAVQGRDAVRARRRARRRPHALDDVRVLRRAVPLRAAVASVRDRVRRCPTARRSKGPAGSAAPFQNFLNYGTPVYPHDTRGYPALTEWKPTNLTYEGTYWRWVQRAWMAGLRLMVMSVNENRVLCSLQAVRENRLRRDGDGAPRARRHPRAAALRRRAAGGPGRGLLPDRHRSVRGAAGDQRGPDGGRARDRGLASRSAAVAGRRRPATARRSTASSTTCTSAASARRCC